MTSTIAIPEAITLTDTLTGFARSWEEVCELMEWLKQPRDVLAIDTETSGLDPFEPGARVRLVQFGDVNGAWTLDAERWPGLVYDILSTYPGQIAMHNSAFDMKWLAVHYPGIKLPWSRTTDTMTLARIDPKLHTAGLKELGKQFWGPAAAFGQEALESAMKRNKWTWDTVPMELPSYSQYAALDCILTARLYRELEHLKRGKTERIVALEHEVRRIANGMELRGFRVDRPYCQEKFEDLGVFIDQAKAYAKDKYGVSIGSTQQLGKWFEDNGVELTERTAGGAPSMGKEVLENLAPEYELADLALKSRNSTKIRSAYFGNILTASEADGRVHCSINTMEARTGRMCLPTSHKLVTDRGVVPVDEIRIGDRTIDSSGAWTTVRAVHRYDDQETVIRETEGVRLEATAEHRWVTWSERGVRRVEPLSSARRTIQLVPDGERADLTSTSFSAKTDGQRFAALVGLLVSDGRCAQGSVPGEGMRAHVYQCEGKFYDEFLRVIPEEAVMYDRVTSADTKSGPHHEIRIKMKWLRPRLEQAGLSVTTTLRNSPDLTAWVASLDADEVWAFLQAVWLSDGSTAHPVNGQISCGSEHLREAIQLAAYRCGYRSRVSNDGRGGWSTKDRLGVKLSHRGVNTRHMKVSTGRADVWCVSTDSGTFTAWSDGPLGTPYLTGNSVVRPALQTLPSKGEGAMVRRAFLPSEGHVIYSADYSSIESRLAANFGDDPNMVEAFRIVDEEGGDFFVELGKKIWDPNFQKSDPRRALAKIVMYSGMYGAGVAKQAATAKISEGEMRVIVDDLYREFPAIKNCQRRYTAEAETNYRREGMAFITTPFGRDLKIDPDKTYTGGNYALQGHAAELLKQALVNCDMSGLGEWLTLPVHDEIVFDVPEDEDPVEILAAIKEAMEVTPDMGYALPLPISAEGPMDRWDAK